MLQQVESVPKTHVSAPGHTFFNKLILWIARQDIRLSEFAILALLSVLANIYFITTYSLSIDDELAAVRTNATVWIAQGRFTIYIIETLLFPQPSTPFSPYLFLSLTQALAYILITRSHGYQRSWKTYANFPLFVAFPTWWAISEFAANVPATGLGFLLIAAAIFIAHEPTSKNTATSRLPRKGLVVVLLAVSAGAYQSLLLVFLTMSAGIALLRSLRSTASSKDVFREYLKQVADTGMVLAAASVLYFAINKSFQALLDVPPAYIDMFFHPEYLRDAPYWLFGMLATHILAIYSGSSTIYGAAMPAASLFMLMAFGVIVNVNWRRVLLHAFMVSCLLGAPFLLNIIAGPSALPMRSMLALAYVVWLLGMLLVSHTRTWWLVAAVCTIGLYQLQIANLLSQYIATATITQAHDRMMAQSITVQILGLDLETSEEPKYVDFYGYRNEHLRNVYPAMRTSVTHGTFFGWDKGNLERITSYMTLLGTNQFRPLDQQTRRALTPEFMTMPVWPRPGAVKRVGNVYLVKIGKDADAAHRSPPSQ